MVDSALNTGGGSPSPVAINGPQELTAIVKTQALEVGFDLVRVATADEFDQDRSVALERLRDGLMDGLPWFNEERIQRGASPQTLLPGARSIICLGLSYFQESRQGHAEPSANQASTGLVARYAWGRDYHKAIKKRMRELVEGLRRTLGSDFAARWYVDDGPMLDRAAAARSGLGWFGKNTNILSSSQGSWIFLGQVITDLELVPDQPLKKTCGNCVRCIDSCPTGAIIGPYVLDNTRCISYLTIENRGEIPVELRPLMKDWVFGCDICQDVCPVNRRPPGLVPEGPPSDKPVAHGEEGADRALDENVESIDLIEILGMSEEDFRHRFRGRPILRAKKAGLQRNACVALGNLGDPSAVPALARALEQGEALVRGHAAWALGRIGTTHAKTALNGAVKSEQDPWVLEEIANALRNGWNSGPGLTPEDQALR